MQKYVKPEFTRETLGNNPTVNALVIPIRTVVFNKTYKTNKDGNLEPLEQDLEYTPFVRFYSTAERRTLRNACSLRGKELLLWIMDELEYGKDYLWINKGRYMEEMNIKSVNTYKEALNELIRYCFLATTVIKDVYWINPDFFFKGDRVKMYPNNLEQK